MKTEEEILSELKRIERECDAVKSIVIKRHLRYGELDTDHWDVFIVPRGGGKSFAGHGRTLGESMSGLFYNLKAPERGARSTYERTIKRDVANEILTKWEQEE